MESRHTAGNSKLKALANRIEQDAQRAINDHQRVVEVVDGLHDWARRAFTAKTANKAARTLVAGVFGHFAAMRLIELVLPPQRQGVSLRRHPADRQLPDGFERYIGTAYEPLLGALHYWRQRALGMPPEDITGARYNDVEAVLQLLIARQRTCPHHPDGRELARMALRDVHMLSWGTSLQRGDLHRAIPRPPGSLRSGTPVSLWPDESTPDDLFNGYDRVLVETEHPSCHWQYPALRDGPAPDPGFCAGRLLARPATTERRARSKEFFAHQGARLALPSPHRADERFSSASVLLLVAIPIAQQTVWS